MGKNKMRHSVIEKRNEEIKQRIEELLGEGKLWKDQIFYKVAKEFNLGKTTIKHIYYGIGIYAGEGEE
jgi:hypothetical protein